MEDITDKPFRIICKEQGADVLCTEFVASEALIRNVQQSMNKMHFDKQERPVGIQLFGHDIDHMREAAIIAEQYDPDFIDLNYGCPVKKIVQKGAGAALLREPEKMVEMTRAVVKAVKKPVTLKTRTGWNEPMKDYTSLVLKLQDAGIKAITIHGRTRSQLYSGRADWTLIGDVKNHPGIHIPVIGNGDVNTPESAKAAFDHYAVDGIMIGRAAIGNPWIFGKVKAFLNTGKYDPEITVAQKVNLVKRHLHASIHHKGLPKGVFEMRRSLSLYFKGLPGFKPYRQKLVTCENPDDIFNLLNEIGQLYDQSL
jgi:nifR3 family TIM-barrel protein